jgi:nucleoside-diphosphate-sugar epimerase
VPNSTTAFVTGGSGFIGGALIERLVRDGWDGRALARSDDAAEAVRKLGAEPVRGGLDDPAALQAGAAGRDVVFHAAALASDWGAREEFQRVNVDGTLNVIEAARAGGARRLVHVGTEAALMAGQALVQVNEDAPLRPDSPALYPSTKAQAERLVRDANGSDLETVVIRPRFVWGPGDTSVLPSIVETVESGRFRWIGGGRQLTATTHVDNTIEGLMLGATRAAPGTVYFVTDGDDTEFRGFVTDLLATRGVEAPEGELPAPVAGALAGLGETLWHALPLGGAPPVTRFSYWVASKECTIDTSRARAELGYQPVKSRAEGLAELRAAA